MKHIQLCTGLLRRDDGLLLVRCRYEGEAEPLWVLPGGRQESGETIAQTVTRECWEETGLHVHPESLAYVSESFDDRRAMHVINCTFHLRDVDAAAQPEPRDPRIVDARFVPLVDVVTFLRADVLRIPVTAALSGEPFSRYFSFDAGSVAVPFFTGTADDPEPS
jgi:ADP-ribose pyrophosphatase YjhB (NUDIX family)